MLMTHKEASGCALLTVHNVAFQLRLMRNIREAIKEDRYKFNVSSYMYNIFSQWGQCSSSIIDLNQTVRGN